MSDWTRPNGFHKLSRAEKEEFLVPLLVELVSSAFDEDDYLDRTPEQVWFEARFGLFSDGREMSEADGFLLSAFALKHPEAWDIAELICKQRLLERSPLPTGLALYVLDRLKGEAQKPERQGRLDVLRPCQRVRDAPFKLVAD